MEKEILNKINTLMIYSYLENNKEIFFFQNFHQNPFLNLENFYNYTGIKSSLISTSSP